MDWIIYGGEGVGKYKSRVILGVGFVWRGSCWFFIERGITGGDLVKF